MKRLIVLFIIFALLLVASLLVGIPVMAQGPTILEVSAPKQLTMDAHYERNPSVFRAYDGTFWLFFVRANSATPHVRPGYDPDSDSYDIYYMTSTDQGNTWSTPTKIPRASTNQRSVAAFQDGIGNIWVFVSGFGGSDKKIRYYKYSAGTWSGPTLVSNTMLANHIDALVARDGKIWIFFEATDSSCDAIYSANGGLTWSSRIHVAGPYGGVPRAIQASNGMFNVVYTNADKIWLTTSSTGMAGTWSTPVQIVDGGASPNFDYDPVLYQVGGSYGLFWAPWSDPGAGGTDRQQIRVITSLDGSVWSVPRRITSGGYKSTVWWDMWPDALVDGSTVYLFYGSEKNGSARGDGNIFMFKVTWDLSRDHFEAIQPAIDAAASPDIVNVAPGMYAENLLVNKAVILNGPNAGINPNTSSRGPEAVLVPEVNNTANGIIVDVVSSTVTIDGFTIDGDNPNLSGGISLNGIDANARSGIENNSTLVSNITIRNNILKNLIRGICLSGLDVGSSGNYIQNNLLDNMPSSSPLGRAILMPDSFYAEVSGNVLTRVYVGIQVDDVSVAGSPALIRNNRIQSYRLGIWLHDHYGSASPFTVREALP